MARLIHRLSITLGIAIFMTSIVLGQSNCKNYHLDKCGGYGPPYKYSGQSKSATFALGESSSFKMTTFGGFEYIVTLCADKQLKGIFFRIMEDTPQKTVLYDGQAEGDEMLEKQFYIEDSKPLIVEVVVPDSDKPREELDYEDTYGCVGVVIEYMKVGKKGFD